MADCGRGGGQPPKVLGRGKFNDRLNITSVEELWSFVSGQFHELGDWDLGYEPEHDRKGEFQRVFFRGQSDWSYGLTTSLYRELRGSGFERPVTERMMYDAELMLIDEARRQGVGRGMTDGQVLMVMQHHGAPTRLLDVSLGALEGLYFAVESAEDRPGVFFIIHTPETEHPLGKLHRSQQLPWAGMFADDKDLDFWRLQILSVKHLSLDPRMHAQRGAFIAGGIETPFDEVDHARLRQIWAGSDHEPVPIAPDLSNFHISWQHSLKRPPGVRRRAVGWTLLIPAEWKRELRSRLAGVGISRDTLYPPVTEIGRLAKYLVKNPPSAGSSSSA
jgi:hypothetical protein